MKVLPPPFPPPDSGGGVPAIEGKSPLLDKEGVGGGRVIHNKPRLRSRRKELRNNPTQAETQLWGVLQHSSLEGFKFRRQHSVGYYILDFYCSSERLAIELDGDSHFTDDGVTYDIERTRFLNALNIRVLRFTNTEVCNCLEAVCERMLSEIRNPSLPPATSPAALSGSCRRRTSE